MSILIMWVVAIILAAWFLGVYNNLVMRRNIVNESWSGIDVQLKRRYDLVPNLVETVKGYASHEKNLFEKVTQARASAVSATGVVEKGRAENAFSETLRSLFAVAENYPDLKASQNFQELQKNLNEIEFEIQASRRYYNGCVRDFNTAVQIFPNSILAKMFNFKARDFFEITEQAQKEAPKVAF